MDITLLFKACVKTIKTKNRAFGQAASEVEKFRLLCGRPPKQEFAVKAKEIIQHITRLNEFLIQHQQAYLNFSGNFAGLPYISDFERDKIDAGAKKIIKACFGFITNLEQDIIKKHLSKSQAYEHEKIVVLLLKEYLKQICKIYSDQKALRFQQTLELKKLLKIDSCSPKKKSSTKENELVVTTSSPLISSKELTHTNTSEVLFEGQTLSSEELQMFELENNELYNDLNSMADEVWQIENKIIKITELQEIFAEKVLQQDKDMSHVAALVVGTTENVKDANDQIRQAIQRNAGLRVWILFFLLVMSFSLLFLDWYND